MLRYNSITEESIMLLSSLLLLAVCDAPVPVKSSVITSDYGNREWIDGTTQFHSGFDFAAKKGTLITSLKKSRVIDVYTDEHGAQIVETALPIGKNKALIIAYAHLSKVVVKKGDIVTAGTIIGHVGSTGSSTSPHLHLTTLLYDGKTKESKLVSPQKYLKFCNYRKRKGRHF
jgi:murein DD-endopeptidase MepM/ murein hydrolase activator NlpD